MHPSARYTVLLASMLVALVALAGCRRASGDGTPARWSRCTCSYMTDRDEPGRTRIEMCAGVDDAAQKAIPCAEGLGVGAVSACVCEAPAGPCDAIGTCREEPDEPK